MTTQEIIMWAGVAAGALTILCALYVKFGPSRIVYASYDTDRRWGRREVYGEGTVTLFGIVGAVVCIIGAFVGGGGVLSSRDCRIEADGMGLESKWTYEGKCQVRVGENTWLRIDKYRHSLALRD